jgi:hypothetical protein
VKHYSVWLDIRILFETFKIVLLGSGSGEVAPAAVRAPAPAPAAASEEAGAAQP